jgi:hypothetical protein
MLLLPFGLIALSLLQEVVPVSVKKAIQISAIDFNTVFIVVIFIDE